MFSSESWMSDLSNDLEIKDISMPGTHDSGAYEGFNKPWKIPLINVPVSVIPLIRSIVPWIIERFWKTQDKTITEQLNSGIRYLDIRLRHYKNDFTNHHEKIYLNKNFEDILKMVISFLKQHPSETVLMRLKLNEHSPEGNTRSANATMKLYYDKYEEFFWKYNNNNNPPLGEIRRRIIIIQDFKSDLKFGLMFTKFILQDNYKPHSVQAKKHSILNYFIKGRNGTKKIINHLSASKNPFYSSKDISKFTNPYMIQLINEKYDGTDTISTKYIGIIPADFPSDMLIRSIILVNAATF